MIRTIFFSLSFLLAVIAGRPTFAQASLVSGEPQQGHADAELIELRSRMEKASQSRDVEALIKELGPDAIITWQNSRRNVGIDEFRTFYREMMEGENSIVESVKTTRELEGTPIFYGDSTAITYGSIKEEFAFRDGDAFTLSSKWTATLVKTDQQWQVVSYHVSADAFNNPKLTAAKRYLLTFATIGAVFGFLLGALITWFVMHSARRLANHL